MVRERGLLAGVLASVFCAGLGSSPFIYLLGDVANL